MTTPSVVLLGDDYLLWFAPAPADATPPAYQVIEGQGTATINRSQTEIDTSSKTTKGYATSAYGLKKLSVDFDVLPSLPDAGYTELETLCNVTPSAPFMVQIRRGGITGATPADVILECLVNGTISSVALTQNDKVQVKGQVSAAAAPTVDSLK